MTLVITSVSKQGIFQKSKLRRNSNKGTIGNSATSWRNSIPLTEKFFSTDNTFSNRSLIKGEKTKKAQTIIATLRFNEYYSC